MITEACRPTKELHSMRPDTQSPHEAYMEIVVSVLMGELCYTPIISGAYVLYVASASIVSTINDQSSGPFFRPTNVA